MPLIVAIIQARIGSTRLPRKVLANINGLTMLERVIERVKLAKYIDEIVVATTDKEEDLPIIDVAENESVKWFVGSENDVLDRYYRAAVDIGADIIVRITADCPLVEPSVIDRIIAHYLDEECDYASNIIKRTYPKGLDTEVFSFSALRKAWSEAVAPDDREHVTRYILNNPDKFKLSNVENDTDLSHLRWCVDTEEDLELVREIYRCLV